jgi:hypothetical protein
VSFCRKVLGHGWLAVIFTASTLATNVACSGSSPGPATPQADEAVVDVATLKGLNDGAHAFQLSLVTKGRFDRSSYERLAATYQQCITEAGGELTEGSMQTAYGTYHFEIAYPTNVEVKVVNCTAEYWEPLGPLWSLSHSASREQIQAGNDALGECLRQAGEDFPSLHPTLDDFHRFTASAGTVPTTFLECTRAVGQQLKLPNFAGG